MDLAALDLNLLVVLDALLEDASVSGAARRLGRTQPAVSQSLARLREMFGDPLLVRAGRGLVPSARGAALAPEVRRVVTEIRALLKREAEFDPVTSTRTFRLACPDLLAPLLPALVARLRTAAPGVHLVVEGPMRAVAGEVGLATALAAPDGPLALLALGEAGDDLRARRLGVVTWGIVMRRDHPLTRPLAAGESTHAHRWLAWPHLLIRTGTGSRNRVADALAAAGHTRTIGLELPSFLMAPEVLAATDLVHVAPQELVAPLLTRFDLVVLPLPLALPPLPVGMAWHERHHADPGHRWLREHVAAVVGAALQSS